MRVPFSAAINDPMLLGEAWDQLSLPQQVVLKAMYGLPLSDTIISPLSGFTERQLWAVLQGKCEYDELGYPRNPQTIPYTPKEYDKLCAVLGRRSGKSSQLMAFAVAYEALLGGHEAHIGRQAECVVYLIAHRLDLAIASLQFVRSVVETSPLLSQELILPVKFDKLSFKNGVSVMPSPPSLRSQRGMAVPVVAMDEVAFWYSDAESANPDFEVERAVSYGQLQFPHAKMIIISTPWTKEGLLYKYFTAGTEGVNLPNGVDKSSYQGTLTVFGPTAACENPEISRKRLADLKRADPDAFDRESLCKYLDSVSGFFNHALLDNAVAEAIEAKSHTRPPVAGDAKVQPFYTAAMDPAFRHDSFALTICHKEARGIVVDLVKRWTPLRGQKLNPTEILVEIQRLTAPYGIQTIYTDQYQFETLQQLALGMGLAIENVDFTGRSKAKIYGNLQQLVNQKQLHLLDPYTNDDMGELWQEMKWLQRHITAQGTMQIAAPEGKQDDMVAALALACHKAAWLDPTVVTDEPVWTPPTLFERARATLKRKQLGYT